MGAIEVIRGSPRRGEESRRGQPATPGDTDGSGSGLGRHSGGEGVDAQSREVTLAAMPPTDVSAADPSHAWPAPHATSPVRGRVAVPGSKSMTNRALILAAISDGPSRITGALLARDTELMIGALRALGAGIHVKGASIDVEPMAIGAPLSGNEHARAAAATEIDCGLAGTVMRFVPAIAGLSFGTFTFDGDAAARLRPMHALVSALHDLGVRIEADCGSLPITIDATGSVPGGFVEIDASASSQFVSALLLAGAAFKNGLTLSTNGRRVPSAPHIEMTISMLSNHGVHVSTEFSEDGRVRWLIEPTVVQAFDRVVEPDLSNATPFIAAAAVTGGEVSVDNWPAESTQPGVRMLPLLTDMGCDVTWEPVTPTSGTLLVVGPAKLKPIDADMGDLGELVPTLAAVCMFAEGTSRLRNISHIRGHETDRIAALVTIASAVGAPCASDESDLHITGIPAAGLNDATPVTLPSFDDHRLATAGAIIGLRKQGVLVENIATTAKTMPEFPNLWAGLVQP